MKIISIHAPKAGGTSMLSLWQRVFGDDHVLADYLDPPADPCAEHLLDPDGWRQRRPLILEPNIRVVHGHFRPHKYDLIDDAFRLTMLRHPIDNIISIYFYWKAIPPQSSALHQYFLAKQLGLLETAKLPLLQRLYSDTYFGGWDMSRLDFIGRHEERPAEVRRLGQLLGLEFDADLHLNANQAESDAEIKAEILSDRKLISQLTDFLAEDIRFYEKYTGRVRQSQLLPSAGRTNIADLVREGINED